MKRFFIVIFALSLFTACQSNTKKAENETKTENSKLVELQELELRVTGMTCSGCENTIKNGLGKMDGIVEVKASHENNKVSIKLEKNKLSREEIIQQIETIGYKVDE